MSLFVNKQEECFSRDHSKTSDLYKCTSRYLAGWAVGAEVFLYENVCNAKLQLSPFRLLSILKILVIRFSKMIRLRT